jgi:cytidyltransferase-like protein
MKKRAVIVSGYFNPIHKGHIEYFNLSKKQADLLFVIVNNDYQRLLKGSKEFMLEDERVLIVSNIKSVDKVFLSIDKDKSVSKTIEEISNKYNSEITFYFSNGGDQSNNLIPEKEICEKLNIKLIDDMGQKVQSSSWLLNNENK